MEAAKDPFKALELVETSPQVAVTANQTGKMIREAIAKARGKQRDEKSASPAWYELERLIPYRDLLFVAGFALVVMGVSRWSAPGALITAGAGLMYAGWLMSR